MPIEPFEITTTYPDGRTETRMSTPAEVAQREADLVQFEADRVARENSFAEIAAKRSSARDKLMNLGLDEDEINAIIR
jgi:hypothetical protein